MARGQAASLAGLLLAACSPGGEAGGQAGKQGSGMAETRSGEVASVPCALAGGRDFTARCELERSVVDGKEIVIVRHPDGGFRRLIVLDGGKRYAAADGSDEVSIEPNGAEIEVTLGDDHYLFPAPGAAR